LSGNYGNFLWSSKTFEQQLGKYLQYISVDWLN